MTFNESEKVTLLIGSHGINVMRWCLAITRCVCLPSSSCVHGLKLSFGRRQTAADGGVQVGRRKIWPVWLHGVGCYDGNNILFVSIWHPDYRPCWSRHNFILLHNKFRVIELYFLILKRKERLDLFLSLFLQCLGILFEPPWCRTFSSHQYLISIVLKYFRHFRL